MDHRYSGQARRTYYQGKFDEQAMTLTVTYDDSDQEEEVSFPLPAVYEVCETCDGRGKHVNPSIDDEGISVEQFAEDPDFEESYRSGHYDVPCYECQGLRVVPRVDEDKIKQGSEEVQSVFKKWQEALEEEDRYRRERESERRYGA